MSLDDCFVALQQDLLENGPVAELSDPASGFKLRLTALSSTIRAMHVVAPANGEYVSIDPQFNYPDPLGREWGKDVDTGMVVLQPGQTTQWKVRLELISLAGGEKRCHPMLMQRGVVCGGRREFDPSRASLVEWKRGAGRAEALISERRGLFAGALWKALI